MLPAVLGFGVLAIALGAGCGSGGDDSSTTASSKPPEKFQDSTAQKTPPPTAPTGKGGYWTATGIFSVGANMKVHVEGGGGAVDNSSGSNCTSKETNETFTTQGNDEKHYFGYETKFGQLESCGYERSWSYFKITVTDPSGKVAGHGESLFWGQPKGYGPGAGAPPFILCDGGWEAEVRYPWVGLNCKEQGFRSSVVKITL